MNWLNFLDANVSAAGVALGPSRACRQAGRQEHGGHLGGVFLRQRGELNQLLVITFLIP